MRIRLISHASVVVDCGETVVWSDPWLLGKAFNESWSLLPPAAWDTDIASTITHVWISHEHPDHFHIPTLRSLPSEFKERVTVLFQENNSDKMFQAFEKLGFRRWQALPHREKVPLDARTSVYCYQEGQMNSCLAVMSGGRTVLNVNDAEIRTPDCRRIVRDIGRADVVLNQFSLAGYSGLEDHEHVLPPKARAILDNVSDNHRDLRARVTIPFASFIYFSTSDNRYMNRYANTPRDVVDHLGARGQRVAVLFPGDVHDVDAADWSSDRALERYEGVSETLPSLPYDEPAIVEWERITGAFNDLSKHLVERFPRALLRLLRPFTIRIPDLGVNARMHLATGTCERLDALPDPDLIVNSQPAWFAFKYPYGVQTLGVSARYTLRRNLRNWQLHRILFSMNNAEMYLRPRYFLTRRNLGYLRKRLSGSTSQLRNRLKDMI